jgi:hypothetical protein
MGKIGFQKFTSCNSKSNDLERYDSQGLDRVTREKEIVSLPDSVMCWSGKPVIVRYEQAKGTLSVYSFLIPHMV